MSPRSGEYLLSVVVPCYNEGEMMGTCHEALTQALSKTTSRYEIVYVNDGSRDDTLEVLRRLYDADPHVKIIDLARNFGHQRAVSAGIEYAAGDAVAIMDADLQDPPEVLLKMLELWKQGYEVIYGVRAKRDGESWFKLASARWFYRVMNAFSDTVVPMDAGDFRLLDRRAVDALLRMREQHRLLRAMSSWIGYRQYGLEYERAPRAAGVTKYPLRKMLALAVDGVLSFSVVPLRLVSVMGLLVAMLASFGIVYALVLRLFTRIWVEGWTLLFIAMLFLGGVQMVSIGIVGEYIGRIYTEVKRRPLFLVREVWSRTGNEPSGTAESANIGTHA
jgi:dolichol-phosphate mannosyltransferase